MKFGRLLFGIWLGLLSSLLVRAQEGGGHGGSGEGEMELPDAVPKKPEVERIGENRFRIGVLSFDADKREIRFPGKVNMTEGLLEYAVVMPHGKMHESLLVSKVNPIHLNVAFKLMSLKAQTKYFPELDENYRPVPAPPLKEEDLSPCLIKASVEWENDGEKVSKPMNQLILNNQTNKSMPAGRWLYTGSVVDNGKYQATLSGDVLAIFNNRASIINFAGDGADDDTIWIPNTQLVPELGTEVTIILHLPPKS